MRSSAGNVLRLLMALTILASVMIRPPGTMLVTEGDTITYVLCGAGEARSVQIALGQDEGEERDLSCDFFAAQIASLTPEPPQAPEFDQSASRRATDLQPAPLAQRRLWLPNNARAPPLVS
ncbi:hypothetical protein [Maritimibacter fusiformis]|uniref:Uncharacterized protein n=1 Tax=Maritimibacter fusiformis TaxID=2603819 RepID=A0A5D0RRP9_9RHOB|nr:hypothetical protein [Maritimibacter fusiformis]TYB83264.1 hypothetical protein FVF75_03550 [Maritimibacter fusiformis]